MLARLRPLLLLAVLASGAVLSSRTAPGEPAAPSPAPIDLEQIVRWHVAGVPAAELERRIRGASFDLDLSDEMLLELRRAGLPETVIQALLERQRELHPPAPVATPAPAIPDETPLALRGTDGGPPVLRMRRELPAPLRAQLQLPDGETSVSGLAIYVACLTATHVPDHWRAQSPLGRDFLSMPRHELLAFVQPLEPSSGAPAVEKTILEARFPESVSVTVAPGTAHRLSIGIAARIGDRYLRVTSDEWEGLPSAVPVVEVRDGDGSFLGVRASFVRGT